MTNSSHFQQRLLRFYKHNFSLFELKLKRELEGCRSFVELGCGVSSPAVAYTKRLHSVGVDGYLPSLKENKKNGYFTDYVLADLAFLPLRANSFDCVAAFDVIEHLPKRMASLLMDNMERVAVRKIVVSTPNGFNTKCHLEDGNPLQVHRCGWTVDEFAKRGFVVFGVDGLLRLRSEQAVATIKPAFFGSFLARLSDLFAFRCPTAAFSLLCIKTKP